MTSDEWGTPPWLYERLAGLLRLTLDAAASDANHLAPAYYTAAQNGLAQRWPGRVYVNPPYSRPAPWVARAALAAADEAELVVMLLPADTSTAWFKTIWTGAAEILFIAGRLAYSGGARGGTARFASCLALFTRAAGPSLRPLADLGQLVRAPARPRRPGRPAANPPAWKLASRQAGRLERKT